MCLISFFKRGVKPVREHLEWGWIYNGDGGGFLSHKNNELIMEKGIFDFEEFWDKFSNLDVNTIRIAHFRLSSFPEINAEMTHPFKINKKHAFVHNGFIRNHYNPENKLSDTANYCNNLLKPLFKRDSMFWLSNIGRQLISDSLGYGNNKIVILSNTGQALIIGEPYGLWDKKSGVWYSNDSFREFSTYRNMQLPRQNYFEFMYK